MSTEGNQNQNQNQDQGKGGESDAAKALETMKAENAKLAARNAELDKKIAEYSSKDKDLLDKSRDQRAADDKNTANAKELENALRFSLKSEDWLKTNQSLLPKDIADLFKTAEKENYSNAIEKTSAIKSGIIQSFFSVQSNVDLLTPGLKTSLDDYLKLTKTGKQEKAAAMYDQVFEPAFEMLKRVKKAEVMNKGYADEGDFENQYKLRMINLSRQTHLGEKAK